MFERAELPRAFIGSRGAEVYRDDVIQLEHGVDGLWGGELFDAVRAPAADWRGATGIRPWCTLPSVRHSVHKLSVRMEEELRQYRVEKWEAHDGASRIQPLNPKDMTPKERNDEAMRVEGAKRGEKLKAEQAVASLAGPLILAVEAGGYLRDSLEYMATVGFHMDYEVRDDSPYEESGAVGVEDVEPELLLDSVSSGRTRIRLPVATGAQGGGGKGRTRRATREDGMGVFAGVQCCHRESDGDNSVHDGCRVCCAAPRADGVGHVPALHRHAVTGGTRCSRNGVRRHSTGYARAAPRAYPRHAHGGGYAGS